VRFLLGYSVLSALVGPKRAANALALFIIIAVVLLGIVIYSAGPPSGAHRIGG